MFGLMPVTCEDMITNFFDDGFFNDFYHDGLSDMTQTMNTDFRVNVRENDNEYMIEASLPGVRKDEIGLDYKNGTVYIGVQHREEMNEEQNGYSRRGCQMVAMQRGIYVGDIDVNAINASFENGVLRIDVPKVAIPDNRYQIEIH